MSSFQVVKIQANKSAVSDNIPTSVQSLSISNKSDSCHPDIATDEEDDEEDYDDDT